MSFPAIKVYASRDFKHYRAVSSPVGAIAQRFFAFMTSDRPEASHARMAYATAYLGHEPKPGAPFAGSEDDRAIQQLLIQPPHIVLAQGPMHPWAFDVFTVRSYPRVFCFRAVRPTAMREY